MEGIFTIASDAAVDPARDSDDSSPVAPAGPPRRDPRRRPRAGGL
jgi:hypothetical protein